MNKSFNRYAYIFWDVPKDKIEQLSDTAIVTRVLGYGSVEDIKALFEILSIEKVKDIFNRIISQKRVNLRPQTINFFKIFFERHVS